MGLFSFNCMRDGCGHPLLMRSVTNDVNGWMSEGVVIANDGSLHVGTYDGYGGVGGAEAAAQGEETVYHVACWELLGQPHAFAGPAPHADDQGYFFDDGAHDAPDPRLSHTTPPRAGLHNRADDRDAQVAREAVRRDAPSTRVTSTRVGVVQHDPVTDAELAVVDVTDQLDHAPAGYLRSLLRVLTWVEEGQHVRIDVRRR